MTHRIAPAALAAALFASRLCAAVPAAAQGPAPLPLQSPSERMIDQSNRDLQLQRRIGEIERQRAFEEGQFRQRLDRLEMFPRLTTPPAPPAPDYGAPNLGTPGMGRQ